MVEAAEDSGSLSTARAAGSRGVGQVFVLPGAPWDPGAAGCNQLIRDGATLVRSLTDILEELGATVTSPAANGTPAWPDLEAPARAVLTALIDGQLLTPGRLAAVTDLPPAALDAALLDLELAGLIRRSVAGIQAISLPTVRVAGAAQPAPPPSVPLGVGPAAAPTSTSGARAPPHPPATLARARSVPLAPDALRACCPSWGRFRLPWTVATLAPGVRRAVVSTCARPCANSFAEVLECGGSAGDDGRDD